MNFHGSPSTDRESHIHDIYDDIFIHFISKLEDLHLV